MVQNNAKLLARTSSEGALTPLLLDVQLVDTMELGEKILEKHHKAQTIRSIDMVKELKNPLKNTRKHF